jgi:hypothetical protein
MVSTTLIMEDTAENFDYTSSIDSETYNTVVLYYKDGSNNISLYTAQSKEKINQWGTLRYFEEVENQSIAANKAKALLKLYGRKSRELTVNGAFGDITVRGGTLIPVKLDLGDIITNNYMLVEKVTHKFSENHYSMDLTLTGGWEDSVKDITSTVIEPQVTEDTNATNDANYEVTDTPSESIEDDAKYCTITVNCNGINAYAGEFSVYLTQPYESVANPLTSTTSVRVPRGRIAGVAIRSKPGYSFILSNITPGYKRTTSSGAESVYWEYIHRDVELTVKWVR